MSVSCNLVCDLLGSFPSIVLGRALWGHIVDLGRELAELKYYCNTKREVENGVG